MGSSYHSEQNVNTTSFPRTSFCMPLSQVIKSQQSCNMNPAHPTAAGDNSLFSQSYQIVPPAPWNSNRSHYQMPLTSQSHNTSPVYPAISERDEVENTSSSKIHHPWNSNRYHYQMPLTSQTQNTSPVHPAVSEGDEDAAIENITSYKIPHPWNSDRSHYQMPLTSQTQNTSPVHPAISERDEVAAATAENTSSYKIPHPWNSDRSHYQMPLTSQSQNTSPVYPVLSERDEDAAAGIENAPSYNRIYPLSGRSTTQENCNKHKAFDLELSQVLGSQKSNHFQRPGSVQTSKNSMFSEVGHHNFLIPPAPVRNINCQGPVMPLGELQHTRSHQTDNQQVSSMFGEQGGPHAGGVQLRSVTEIPSIYQDMFSFPYFNILQSLVFDEVFYTDRSIVVSAPTGSGKTVVFELALIRLLTKRDNNDHKLRIVYMAPMKALCSERYRDWTSKLTKHGITCLQITGDSELDDFGDLLQTDLICTTPEKWDSMSRRWKDNRSLFHQIQLFLIDEIHILNDANRGATVEAVVSRMKTLQTANAHAGGSNIRFVAASATMPNYNDIATWLGTSCKPAAAFNLGEKFRPVKLDRIVLGYPFKEGSSDFRFDMNLSYRLRAIIETYSHGKPTLVFCSSRKSVIQTAEVLVKSVGVRTFLPRFTAEVVQRAANSVHDSKLADLMLSGVGMHHAGMDTRDRQVVEELFRTSQLPVLISTSTLAMGVNLPAHLVIIKSTHFYNLGVVQEYSDMQILQMIGRAGRPQFDTSATAVIMTKAGIKAKYESLVNGTQLIESSLHKNLTEHLNAEIVLQTISEISLAVEWIRHTFLYVRVMKNPKYYGLPANLSTSEVENRLTDLCQESLSRLSSLNLVSVNETTSAIYPTSTGRLMARFCIAYETMKQFHNIEGDQASIADMLTVMSRCSEFEDIQLRTSEKKILNSLNSDKTAETIRFPMSGKIRTREMKVNCLIQAQLSCLPVQDFSLSQDMAKIFRVGQRVAKCLMEFMYQRDSYSVLLHAILIYKAFTAKLWFDSKYVARQLDGIGPTMSLALANSGLTSFEKLEEANPREIEVIVNRHPPFGNQVKEAVSSLPKYELGVEQLKYYKPNKAILVLSVSLLNRALLETRPSSHSIHQSLLIVGDLDNRLIFKCRISDAAILRQGHWNQTLEVKRSPTGTKLNISLLSQDWVGLDICVEYTPMYSDGWFESAKIPQNQKTQTPAAKLSQAVQLAKKKAATPNSLPPATTPAGEKPLKTCSHRCLDKSKCGHTCCKMINTSTKRMTPRVAETPGAKVAKREPRANRDIKEMFNMVEHCDFLRNMPRISLPMTPGSNVALGKLTKPRISQAEPGSCLASPWGVDDFDEFDCETKDADVFVDDFQGPRHTQMKTGAAPDCLQWKAHAGNELLSLPQQKVTADREDDAGREEQSIVWSTTTSSDDELCHIAETTTADNDHWSQTASNLDLQFHDVYKPDNKSQKLDNMLDTRSKFYSMQKNRSPGSQSVISISSSDSRVGGVNQESRSPFFHAGQSSQPVTPTLQASSSSSITLSGKQKLDVDLLKSGHPDRTLQHDGDDDDRSSSQQSHRYGLVQAWKKGPAKSCTREESGTNPANALSMFCVPRHRITTQDSRITTNLFEGIF